MWNSGERQGSPCGAEIKERYPFNSLTSTSYIMHNEVYLNQPILCHFPPVIFLQCGALRIKGTLKVENISITYRNRVPMQILIMSEL